MTPGRKRDAVAQWNATHPIGCAVLLEKANGVKTPARVRYKAEWSKEGVPVVWLMGIAGPKPLVRVSDPPMENEQLRAVINDLVSTLKHARVCISYCRDNHPDPQKGEGIPFEALIDAAIERAAEAVQS